MVYAPFNVIYNTAIYNTAIYNTVIYNAAVTTRAAFQAARQETGS